MQDSESSLMVSWLVAIGIVLLPMPEWLAMGLLISVAIIGIGVIIDLARAIRRLRQLYAMSRST